MQQELFKLQWEQMLGALWLYVSSVNPILIRDCKFMEGEKLQSIRSQEVSNAYRIAQFCGLTHQEIQSFLHKSILLTNAKTRYTKLASCLHDYHINPEKLLNEIFLIQMNDSQQNCDFNLKEISQFYFICMFPREKCLKSFFLTKHLQGIATCCTTQNAIASPSMDHKLITYC